MPANKPDITTVRKVQAARAEKPPRTFRSIAEELHKDVKTIHRMSKYDLKKLSTPKEK